jgi:hypothetical protein
LDAVNDLHFHLTFLGVVFPSSSRKKTQQIHPSIPFNQFFLKGVALIEAGGVADRLFGVFMSLLLAALQWR